MDLEKRYQPGVRKNSFYELQGPEEEMSKEDRRKLLGQGSVVVKTQKADPYNGEWIGLGKLRVDTESR